MDNSDLTKRLRRAESLARGRAGFTVPPSPFNVVKLDLGILLLVALMLFLVLSKTQVGAGLQLLLLSAYSCTSMVWLISRTRSAMRKCGSADQERSEVNGGAQ